MTRQQPACQPLIDCVKPVAESRLAELSKHQSDKIEHRALQLAAAGEFLLDHSFANLPRTSRQLNNVLMQSRFIAKCEADSRHAFRTYDSHLYTIPVRVHREHR